MNVESFVRLEEIENGLYQLVLDATDSRMNVLSKAAIAALGQTIEQLPLDRMRGLLICSAKAGFVAGADITEFCDNFAAREDTIFDYGMSVHKIFNRIEDLPLPTVVAIRGEALGGGLELALSADFRVVSDKARLGLPEVNLGILPGWGGSVRLPRLIGVDNALNWMTQGRPMKAAEALRVGVADAVIAADDQLEAAALRVLQQAVDGELDYQRRRQLKTSAMTLAEAELTMACDTATGMVAMTTSEHYPAARRIIESVRQGVRLSRAEAQAHESRDFIALAKSTVARNLVTLFLSDQQLKKTNRNLAKDAQPVQQAAVLGAGIMGGGVAYQSASTGTPIVMKDIAQSALDTGMAEANRLMLGQIKRKKMTPEAALQTSQRIQPRLDYQSFEQADLVVEAVVENPAIKRAVLAEVEQQVGAEAVLATNTSTLTVAELAAGLTRPQNFCGMHFFNPVHRMPLVEIIRGPQTSELAINRAVSYALAMQKVPVVVGDCAGFLVNRILLPYVHAFARLVMDGVDFERIDKVMEAFGWPMGPATLADIVGMDTGHHAEGLIAKAYPDRYLTGVKTPTDVLFEAGRLGQKSGAGYYRYETDKRGKLKKKSDPAVRDVLQGVISASSELSDEQIIQRMMIPMCLEAVRCLEEGIASSAGDVDIALVNGVGFPRYLGGVFGYIDSLGLADFVASCDQWQSLGMAYQPTAGLRQMAAAGQSFHAIAAH
ncbi:fatty acid oxidation complex subunit alpha FadB [Oceanobacter mangrovi]|uniref:fatty acid oxidation complex subunit alpha FadB n=1 Tax=Oceanobacter mangrovi TaxID=2862510 RepID=UPI001C8D3B55|nr:fatty acid oxidation complex subunit alpha FadB [Oceanobacter mangrovi]